MAALFELSADKAVSDMVIEAGGLKLLIKTMKNGTPLARALAAGTLGKLAIDIDLLVKIASRGALPPLVRCYTCPHSCQFIAQILTPKAQLSC